VAALAVAVAKETVVEVIEIEVEGGMVVVNAVRSAHLLGPAVVGVVLV